MTRICRSFVVAATLASLAGGTWAGTCGPERDADLPLLEDAKAAFLAADYALFAELAGPYFHDLADNYDAYFGPIERLIPQGFVRCTTILQRREAPGFHQDLVFFFADGVDGPVAVLMVSAEVDGEERMIEFSYNTNISDVLSDLQ